MRSRELLRQLFDPSQHKEQRYGTEQAKGAIDETPVERNTANGPANERERKNGRAGDQAYSKHPGIAHRIEQGPDKEHRDDNMSERQPISSIREERMSNVGLAETLMHPGDPPVHTAFGRGKFGAGPADQEVEF